MANEFLKGLLRGGTADVLGTPVDLANTVTGLLAPPSSGNPYANALRGLLGDGIETGSGDWWAQKLGTPEGQGLAYEAGRMLAPSPSDIVRLARSLGPNIAELIAYHGTPHRFQATENNPLGAFDLAKIGSGEGAQAYGHGIYLAETPEVARSYQQFGPGSKPSIYIGDKEYSYESPQAQALLGSPEYKNIGEAKQELQRLSEEFKHSNTGPKFEQSLNAIKDLPDEMPISFGSFYTSDIPDKYIDKMLDWDKPLSKQSDEVKKSLQKLGIGTPKEINITQIGTHEGEPVFGGELPDIGKFYIHRNPGFPWKVDLPTGESIGGFKTSDSAIEALLKRYPESDPTGEEIYKSFLRQTKGNERDVGEWAKNPLSALEKTHSDPAAVSELLRSSGIIGNKYLDGSSRGAGEGTRNFVLFDPSIAKIIKRD